MNTLRRLLFSALFLLLAAAGRGAPLAEADLKFLGQYETIRAALAADDLAAAQAAARALPAAQPVAEAASLSAARKAFKELSGQAVALVRGREGYYVIHCSMFPGGADWVQTTKEIANPYWGKSMLRCGERVQ